MSLSGGGDIGEVLLRLGREALEHEAESHGLSPRAGRMRCPWEGCEVKGAERKHNAVISAGKGGKFRVYCHACGTAGDLVDLLQRTRGFSKEEAIAHVRGVPVSEKPRPELRVVPQSPADDPEKMQPSEVERIWKALGVEDELGRAYLAKRRLDEAIDAGFVRFADRDSKDKRVSGRARQGYVVAALTSDVVGQPRGIQLRLARAAANSREVSIVSVKGSVTKTAFFGEPGLIETAHLVAIAEGFADTLALRLWAGERAVTVGGAGKGTLPNIALELEAAGVEVRGKLFALFPQNDDPRDLKKTSRAEFVRLAQLLKQRGAEVCWVKTPAEYSDLADWLQAQPETAWPPAELAIAMDGEPGDDTERRTVLPAGMALPMPTRVETDKYAQNFTTLVSLIDDPASRLQLFHTRDALWWCEMTGQPKVGGREFNEGDISTVRLGLESYARATDGKPLQFKESDIEKAIAYVAKRTPVHEIRAEVEALPAWDGVPRLETQLPGILGHTAGSFEGLMLRRWLVSAIARVMKPGCQVDTVLILTGGQGAQKTKFFRHIGGRWTTSSKVQPGDEEGMMVMRQFWFVEWGELSSMRSRSREVTKDFITNSVDTFRWPWGRRPVSAPRHTIIVGTTNDKQMLEDPTGNRRYWPIEVLVDEIDIPWLDRNREQLFAEAFAIYRAAASCPACITDSAHRCADHRWWLTKDEESQLRAHQLDFEAEPHPWFDVIADWIEEKQPQSLTTAQILRHGVEQKVEHFKSLSGLQIAELMDRLGWKKARRDGARGPRIWIRKEALL